MFQLSETQLENWRSHTVTSNPGAKDIELQKSGERHIYELVADMTKSSAQAGLVVGLTNAAPDVLSHIPDVPLLIPGLGAQGGRTQVEPGEALRRGRCTSQGCH